MNNSNLSEKTLSGLGFDDLEIWKQGLEEADLEKIRNALDKGIPPQTYVNGKHPLFVVLDAIQAEKQKNSRTVLNLVRPRDGDKQEGANVSNSDEDNSNKIEVIKLLLERGLSLLEPLKGPENEKNSLLVIDGVADGRDVILESQLVYEAIKECLRAGKPPYSFGIDKAFNIFTPRDGADVLTINSLKSYFLKRIELFEEIHNYIRLIIENPTSEADKQLFTANKDKLSFWLNDFQRPSEEKINQTFPVNEEELKRAIEAAAMGPMAILAGDNKKQDSKIVTLQKEDPEDIMKELNQYVGLEEFKKSMRSLITRVQFNKAREAQGLSVDDQNFHTAFLGNPGTGKTTCARIKARILHSLDMIGPRYAELSRDDIVGKYVGHSENNLKEIIEKTDTLFIDEAYALTEVDTSVDYGGTVVNTLVAKMGNDKDKFTLFAAGYTEPMKRFVASNKGLSSRIKTFEEMHDFSRDALEEILDRNLEKHNYEIDEDAKKALLNGVEVERQQQGGENFGNARVIVSLVQELPNQMALRLASQGNSNFEQFNAAALSKITITDVEAALKKRLIENSNKGIGFLAPV